MLKRFGAYAVIPAVFVAGGLALWGVEQVPGAASVINATPRSGTDQPGEMLPTENGGALPPDHPSIGAGANGAMLPADHPSMGGADSPQGPMPSAAGEPPALVWKVPATWQEAPNPNAMRLATYHVPGGVEVAVSRAGGATEANIQRWISQFDDVGHDARVEKTVHGLRVVTVDVAGTYVGGGMAMGTASEPKPGWALVGAIVESRSPSYFFKMTGPVAAVHAARPVFDRFLESITPTT
jgi:hypothetical protein